MGLLSKAEGGGQNQNADDARLSEEAHAARRRQEDALFSPDFSFGSADIFSLSTKLAINEKLKNLFEKGGDEFSRASTALYGESLGVLKAALAHPNAALRGENGEAALIIFTSQNLDEKLLQTHIRRTLAPLLGEAANLLAVTRAGRAASVEEAKKILEG